jgi:RimJ/RimL family protein N-acetyltransferase
MTPVEAALAQLPDVHRWVEARASLLTPEARVFALRSGAPPAFVVREHASSVAFVVGLPDRAELRGALARPPRATEVIAGIEHADAIAAELDRWERAHILVHALSSHERLPPPDESVRFLDPDCISRLGLDEELEQELEIGAAEGSPIAATFVGDAPVAFCYAGSVTETLWDVAVDTVEPHRRRGYAALAVAYMIRHMHTKARAPVWQALDDNLPSLRLAAKLGFAVVDEVVQFVATKGPADGMPTGV